MNPDTMIIHIVHSTESSFKPSDISTISGSIQSWIKRPPAGIRSLKREEPVNHSALWELVDGKHFFWETAFHGWHSLANQSVYHTRLKGFAVQVVPVPYISDSIDQLCLQVRSGEQEKITIREKWKLHFQLWNDAVIFVNDYVKPAIRVKRWLCNVLSQTKLLIKIVA